MYKVDKTGTKVPNAKFKITAAKKITNASGKKVYYKKGQVVDTIITDESGVATKEGLPLRTIPCTGGISSETDILKMILYTQLI